MNTNTVTHEEKSIWAAIPPLGPWLLLPPLSLIGAFIASPLFGVCLVAVYFAMFLIVSFRMSGVVGVVNMYFLVPALAVAVSSMEVTTDHAAALPLYAAGAVVLLFDAFMWWYTEFRGKEDAR